MKQFVLSAFLFFNTFLYSQILTWQQTYDRGNDVDDAGYGVCKSNGDNYFIACTSNDSLCIIKINSHGEIIFTRMINSGRCLAITSSNDGGCIITGKRYLSFSSKIDSLGNLVWFREYTNVMANFVECINIITDLDNGYVACGYVNAFTYNMGYVFKIDNGGSFLIGHIVNNHIVYKGVITNASSLMVAGYENNNGLIGRIDTSSNTWIKTFKINGLNTLTNSILYLKSYYALSAETFQPNRNDVYFVKTDLLGDTTFIKKISASLSEYSPKIFTINSNKFVFISNKDTLDNNPGFAVIRLIDSSGNLIREKMYKWNNTLELLSFVKTNNNGFLFVGWNKNFNASKRNIYALKTDSLLEAVPPFGIHNEYTNILENFFLNQNYPNPFNPVTRIKFGIPAKSSVDLKVYDVTGRLVSIIVAGELETGSYTADFDASNVASGIYYYELTSRSYNKRIFRDVKKMVVLK